MKIGHTTRLADGIWTIRRDAARRYTVTHLPTGRTHQMAESEAVVRRFIASGWVLRAMDDKERRDAGLPYRYTDLISGVTHEYTSIGWHCNIHGKECAPFRPLTPADVLKLAANDPNLPDDVFALLAPAIENRPITP